METTVAGIGEFESDVPNPSSSSPRIGPEYSRRLLSRAEGRRPARRPEDDSDTPVVYVVDDDASVCRALGRLFRASGLSTETFPSAKAFLDHPTPPRPMCLILDVRLPGPSGLDLQDALARAGRDLPIIFITGHGDVPSTVRAMKGGAIDLLQKPFNDAELLNCVHRALERSRVRLAERSARAALQQRLETLTARERDVLLEVVTGKLNKQIAGDLGIAEKTVKVHRGRVMQKMHAGSVADLVRMVQKLGLAADGLAASS
jgi:FixJ family two-component response regulator